MLKTIMACIHPMLIHPNQNAPSTPFPNPQYPYGFYEGGKSSFKRRQGTQELVMVRL